MVDTQIRPSDVTKFPVIDAFLSMPRELFVPNALRQAAYAGENIEISDTRVVLEARTLAKMIELLDVGPDHLVLDIAPGLGYSSAILSRLSEAVVALESDPDLAREAESNLAEAEVLNVAVVEGALAEGAAKHGPYDIVLIGGAVRQVPDTILDQIKSGGRIAVLFQEGRVGVCKIGIKSGEGVSWRFGFNAGAPVLPEFDVQGAFVL